MNTLTYSEIQNTPYTKIVISKKCPLHSHSFFEISICLDGSYTNIINGLTYRIKKGNVLLLRPQDQHYFIKGERHTHRDIYVQPEKMKAICDSIQFGLFEKLSNEPLQVNFTLSDYELKRLENKLNFFNNLLGRPTLAVQVAHTSIITEVFNLWQQSLLRGLLVYPEWINTLLSQLNTEEFLLKNVNEIVESTHYSHGYVCREFKKYVGVTLKEYLSDSKFSYAQAMLCDKGTSVSNVAEILNYGSTSNFIIAFKRKYGITPAQWKKSQFPSK